MLNSNSIDALSSRKETTTTLIPNNEGISVVIPVYNEAGNINSLVSRLITSLKPLGHPFELRFVDDHSTDDTVILLLALSRTEPVVVQYKQGAKGKAFSLLEGF